MTPKDKKQYPRKPRICEGCGETFVPPRYNSKYCSIPCFSAARSMQPRKSAGKTYEIVTKGGVKNRIVLTEDGRHVAEHRVVFEKHWGVKLKKWHRVKHKNGDTLDNRPENLTLDNEYAMELLRQGKSIAEVGHTICTKGHQRENAHMMKDGTVKMACRTCKREEARRRREAK